MKQQQANAASVYIDLLSFQMSTLWYPLQCTLSFSGVSESKETACHAGDPDLILGLGRSPGEGNGNTPQYSCPENPMDRRAWWATVHGVTKRRTRLSDFTLSVIFNY